MDLNIAEIEYFWRNEIDEYDDVVDIIQFGRQDVLQLIEEIKRLKQQK